MNPSRKTITTDIDEYGNFVADFSGFEGDECLHEEERFRRELEALGLIVRPESSVHHPPTSQTSHQNRSPVDPLTNS